MGESTYVIIEENGKICVNRLLKPMILQDHMTIEEWMIFCDQLDEILKPANQFKTGRKCYLISMDINLMLLVINLMLVEIFFVQCRYHGTNCHHYQYYKENHVHIIAFFHFVASMLVFLVYFLYNVHWYRTIGKTIREGFEKVCARMNEETNQKIMQYHVKPIPSNRASDYSCCLRRYCCFGSQLYVVTSCIEITVYSPMGYGDTDAI